MEWESLLATNKLGPEAEEPKAWASYPINAFEKDYNKIVSRQYRFPQTPG